MKAVGYKKSLPIDAPEALIDFEAAKPEPKGRDVRVAVKAISANPVDYKVRKRAAPPGSVSSSTSSTLPTFKANCPHTTCFRGSRRMFRRSNLSAQLY